MDTKASDVVRLSYSDGNSDKEYAAWLSEERNLFHVDFAYGRRGSALKTGRKTTSAVPRDTAQSILDKLVKSKLAKGYQVDGGGDTYQVCALAQEARKSGIAVQLLNPIEAGDLDRLLDSPAHLAQEKFDGCRMVVEKGLSGVRAVNRRGLYVGMSVAIREATEALPAASCLIDGECVGARLHAFDLLALDGEDLRGHPYVDRLARLSALLGEGADSALALVTTAASGEDKRALLSRVTRDGGEGIVFKEAHAGYVPDRPATGGVALKHKLYETCSVVVGPQKAGKRSVSMLVLANDAQTVAVGNVTVPPNQEIPPVGAVIEVRYLYAMRGGALIQPCLLGVRSDIAPEECTLEQLKYKGASLAA